MTDEELDLAVRVYNHREPFCPYLMEFFSGRQVPVDSREGVAFLAKLLWLYRGPSKAQSIFPGSSVCRLLDIIDDLDRGNP